MLRFAWYEAPDEPCEWHYCIDCDREGREPCIQVFWKKDLVDMEEISGTDIPGVVAVDVFRT